jgi:hypothetical protein
MKYAFLRALGGVALLLLGLALAAPRALADTGSLPMLSAPGAPGAPGASNSSDSPDAASTPPAEAVRSAQALLALAGDRQAVFDPQAAAPLLDYILAGPGDGLELPAMNGASGAMSSEIMNSPLARILEYAYNPEVPAYLTYPSVVRASGWQPGSDILTHPGLWTLLDDLDRPVVLHGREFEEITPDTFSGGYYRYDLDRALVLMRHKGRAVLLSIATQDGLSGVGKKGVVLDDGNWQYFYSGIDGLTRGGMGWMDTYMYGSWSVTAYVENPGGATTTSVVFKWLRAGWAKMNVVRSKHILAGCRRFADAFNAVLGSDRLPPAEDLAAKARELREMPEGELDRRVNAYAAALRQAYADHPELAGGDFGKIMRGDVYAETLDRAQRVGVLLLEYLKSRLGTLSLARE